MEKSILYTIVQTRVSLEGLGVRIEEMPIANGNMYSELYIHPYKNDVFNILILNIHEEYLHELMQKVQVLGVYLNDKSVNVEINFYILQTDIVLENSEQYGYEVYTGAADKESVIAFCRDRSIDLIYLDNPDFITTLYKEGVPHQLAETKEQLENEIEAFLTGKDIAWNLNVPVWNTTWFTKDIDESDITENPRQLMSIAASELGYNHAQINFVRGLVNKIMQIRRCEEMLLSYIQKKNYHERNHTQNDVYGYETFYDFSYEINYHLGNYYFLISGTIDMIGRLLAETYNISVTDVKPNIEHAAFQMALSEHNILLAYYFADTENNEWMTWLKRKRNYVAHESEVSYTDILQDKTTRITEAEVERKLLELRNWDEMKGHFGNDRIDNMMEVARSVIRMKEDHEVYTKNAMQIKYTDYETRQLGEAIFHPLIDVKSDYSHIRDLINFVTSELWAMGTHE